MRSGAVSPTGRMGAALALVIGAVAVLGGGGCAEMGGNAFLAGYGYGASKSPSRSTVVSAPQRPRVVQSTLPKVDRGETGAGYRQQMAAQKKWQTVERERLIEEYLETHGTRTGYGAVRAEVKARLEGGRRALEAYQDKQDVLGHRSFSQEYERRLREGIAKDEAELARIDDLIVDAMLAEEAGRAARRGAPTPDQRKWLGTSEENARFEAGESRRRADEVFRGTGW